MFGGCWRLKGWYGVPWPGRSFGRRSVAGGQVGTGVGWLGGIVGRGVGR